MTDDFWGKPFKLLDWQKEFISNVYGNIKENGYRQYKTGYLEIGKKNGKTTLIAALLIYHLICGGEAEQIYCCAGDRDQASLSYKAAIAMIDQDEFLSDKIKIIQSKKELRNKNGMSFVRVLSSESYSKHGINPTFVLFDELHAQPNRDLWDVMTFGAGSTRKEPLTLVITTAGDDPDRNSIGWEIHTYSQKIIDGELIDSTWYAKIFGLTDEDDIYDEKNWYKANPSLGVSLDIDTVRQEANQAKNSESAEKLFKWLRCNFWLSLKSTSWLPLSLWDKTEIEEPENLEGMKCLLGIDLSSKIDLTGLALIFPPQEGLEFWYTRYKGFIPEEKLKERMHRDKVPFDIWVKQEHIFQTPGPAIEYSFMTDIIEQYLTRYQIENIYSDSWNIMGLMTEIIKRDLPVELIEVPQTIAVLSPAMKEKEKLMKNNEMFHEHNPAARWCFGNLVIYIDGNENQKPMKNKSRDRIDLISAEITALSQGIKNEEESVYERRGMKSF